MFCKISSSWRLQVKTIFFFFARKSKPSCCSFKSWKFLARWIIKGQVALILYSWRRSSNPNSSERTPWIIDCSNYVVFFLAKKIMSSFFFWKKLYWLCLYTIYCISDLVVDRLSRNSFKGKTLLRVQVTYLPCKAIILFGLRIWPL